MSEELAGSKEDDQPEVDQHLERNRQSKHLIL